MLGPFDGYSTIQIGIAGVVVGSWSSDFVVPAGGAKKERPRHVTGGAKLSYMQQPARRAGEIEPTPFRHRMSLPHPAARTPPNRHSLRAESVSSAQAPNSATRPGVSSTLARSFCRGKHSKINWTAMT